MVKMKRFCLISMLMLLFVGVALIGGCAFTEKGKTETVHITCIADTMVEVEVEKGILCSEIEIPKKEGYRFVGWYRDEEYVLEFPLTSTIKEDLVLYAKFEQLTYTVKLVSGAGYRFIGEYEHIAVFGENYSFSLELLSGYDKSKMQVLVGDDVLLPNADGTYTIENITKPLVVKVSELRALNHYSIHMPTNQVGYSIVSLTGTNLLEGSTYSFCVSIDPAYSKSEYVVYANDKVIKAKDGVYAITNLSSDIYLEVKNVKRNEYKVYFTASDYTIVSDDFTNVLYGENYSFGLEFSDKYSVSSLVVTANGKELRAGDNGLYHIENITEDTYIDVTGYAVKEIHITYDASVAYEISFDHATYYYGNSAKGTIRIKEGYNADNLVVKANGNFVQVENNIFELSNMTEDIHITIESIRQIEINVTIVSGEGYTISLDKNKVYYGDTVTTTVVVEEGFDDSNAYLSINGKICSFPTTTLSHVKEDLSIEVGGVVRKTYIAIVKNHEGVNVTLSSYAPSYGDDLYIDIDIDEDYDATEAKLLINDKEFTLDTGVIENVKEDITIEVVGVKKKTFTISVTWHTGTSVTVNKEKVTIHDSVVVTVEVTEGYDDSVLILHINDNIVRLNSLTYSIEDICENLVIYLEDLEKISFTVRVNNVNGVTVSTIPTSVSYGDSIEFTITASLGYDISNMTVKANDEVVDIIDGEYLIENIKSNIVISIENVVKETFLVTLPHGEGYQVVTEDNSTVEFGDSFTFKIVVEDGYELKEVRIGNESLTASADVYTISDIRENKTITIVVEKKEIVNPTPTPTVSEFEVNGIAITVIGLDIDIYDYEDYFTVGNGFIKVEESILQSYTVMINDEQIAEFNSVYELGNMYEVTITFVQK